MENQKKAQEEISKIADSLQQECHSAVNEIMTKTTTVSYQDATNTWLFYELAKLHYKIQELAK